MDKIILASTSPRRREILNKMSLEFEIIQSDADETIKEKIKPDEAVKLISERKALNTYEKIKDKYKDFDRIIIIAADTVVSIDNKILGKPKNKNNAFEMLNSLSGKKHFVYTGITIAIYKDNALDLSTKCECTEVYMRNLTENEIKKYIDSENVLDKAGAYAIQSKGAVLIEKINGDYLNIVGLPITLLYKMLKDYDIHIL